MTIGVGGWVSPSLAITVVRQWACVRAPSASWCALQGVMCALCEFFAREPEPTGLSHGFLRNLLTAKKLQDSNPRLAYDFRLPLS